MNHSPRPGRRENPLAAFFVPFSMAAALSLALAAAPSPGAALAAVVDHLAGLVEGRLDVW